MGLTARQFVDRISLYGIVPESQLATIGDDFSAADWQADAESLIRDLVGRRKLLTKFQALNIYQGRGRGLVYGEYLILDKIGEGGMGQVYKAQHRRMKRTVALKVLPPHAIDSPKAVQRFFQEVEVAARLQHPNIVIAYDAGEAHRRHYLAMEYVDGEDLASHLKKHGPLGVEQAVNVVLQAARGLDHAHGLGIIHRDVKPSNLLVDRRGVVKILDLGLARYDDPVSVAARSGEELTVSGEVMGTVDYMAPEQAGDTRNVDHRADIYALGCTLYRLLIGRPPYSGETMIQKFLAHREQPIPSLRGRRSDVPEALDRLYQKMLAKNVGERWPTIAHVITALEKLLGGVDDERSSVVLETVVPKDDKFDISLLPPPVDGGSNVLATASNLIGGSMLGGSQLGGSKPGSTTSGIGQGATQVGTFPVVTPRKIVTARRADKQGATPSGAALRPRTSPLVLVAGGAAAASLVAVALFFAFGRGRPQGSTNEPSPRALAAGPSSSSTPADPGSATATADLPNPRDSVDPIPPGSKPMSTAEALDFFRVGASQAAPAATPPAPSSPSPSPTTAAPTTITPTTVASLPQPSASVPPPGATSSNTASSPFPIMPAATPAETATLLPAKKAGVRIDLLLGFDLKRDVIDGAWGREAKALTKTVAEAERGRSYYRVQFQASPPLEYDLLMEATLLDRQTDFSVGLPLQGKRTAVAIDGQAVGLDLDGTGYDNESTAKGATLGIDVPFTMNIRVRRDGMSVALNGKPIIDWKGDPKRLSVRAGTVGPDPSKISLGCRHGVRITRLELTPVGGDRRPVPAVAALSAAKGELKAQLDQIAPAAGNAEKLYAAEQFHARAATTDDDALCFALLTEAVKLCVAADDLHYLQYVLEDLGRCFEVDATAEWNKSLAEIAARTRPVKERTELIARLLATADESTQREQYAAALPLVKAAVNAANRTTDNELKKEARYREQEAQAYADLAAAAATARVSLAATPDDGPANQAVGTYLAVARSDWVAALPHLAKADEATIGAAARLEGQSGGDPAKTAEVAAAWIEAADKSSAAAKAVYFDHARRYFADGAASTKSVATSKMMTRFKKVESDILRTIGSAFVPRHPTTATPYGGHWYQFFEESMPWAQARDRCRRLGGHLVCIETAAENQWVYQFASARYNRPGAFDFLIGIDEAGHPGVFTWVNGSPFSFADWNSGNPDSARTDAGGYVRRDGNNVSSWVDNPVRASPYICEWDR